MKILSIDTSCDETAVAITSGRRVLSNVVYSQVLLHKKWGGVVPSIARKAHEERIDFVINEALSKAFQGKGSIRNSFDFVGALPLTKSSRVPNRKRNWYLHPSNL